MPNGFAGNWLLSRGRRSGITAFAAASVLIFAAEAMAQTADAPGTGDPAQTAPLSPAERTALVSSGRSLAEQRCQSCHSIDMSGASSNKDAPPFRDLAAKWPVEDLEEALGEGIVTGHEEMPEFVFTPDEITAFTEFLRTLGPVRN